MLMNLRALSDVTYKLFLRLFLFFIFNFGKHLVNDN